MNASLPGAPAGVLVCDGAMGTMLHAAGYPLDQSLPHLNLSDPRVVRAVHDSYLQSGVDIVQTNTFGASRLRLAEAGLADATEQINRAGAQIARQAAVATGRTVLVAGSVSPAVTVHQRGSVPGGDRVDALREQVEVLVSADVDVLIVETFGYLEELVEAVEVASGYGVPVIAEATFAEDGRTLSGHTVAEVARAIPPHLVAALGANCTLGPQGCLSVVRELSRHTEIPLVAQPNAGLPRRVGPSRFEYAIDSEYLVRYVRQLIDAGVAVVGGCCGTTPAQIGAVVEIVGEHRGNRERLLAPSGPPPGDQPSVPGEPAFPVAAELVPPAPGETAALVDTARRLRTAGVETIVVSASRATRARGSTINLAVHLGDQVGIDPIVAVPTWDRTIMALQADLLGASVLGVRRIVCETGSPPPLGDYPSADGVWEVDAVGLIELLRGLNEGRDHHGVGLTAPTAFEIGARINLGRDDLDAAIGQAAAEIAAGAGFLLTEPIYELEGLDRLVREVGGDVPVLARLRPLTSFDEADYLRHEVPDVRMPSATVRELERAGADGRMVGHRMATELATGIAEHAHGLVVCGTEASDVEFVEELIGLCRRVVSSRRTSGPPPAGRSTHA
ncbi:bifunctional homocysteine S-methyltransferase/methylenetetrahydrofolate reductase [Actinomycetospora sp. NBRC 106375]|uniref:bifunctional homocysteine S-methyltransferase/methylenetetrahydrofolate reductase n=1 Tax=Actinomycetospora sp. NBRC 106375 TaxID=3032207 RepID=UPI00249F9803|nr:bifunctional homocysteine S-methyltransferase/methylenetetrahydrofolate reductase [Actinomycetospora sp. NBRC 106375]GLZ50139.1 bifunctional homocysteine S-methyltransferase/methylenetetrahydrofolate reductase [Actinomycetospora sp. NBRC 106375]